ncbi:MAG TPA: hypothetical protein VFZ66_28190 [Herpetosiphonaceae bacterium]
MSAPWQPPDLDEIRPDRFIINNGKLRPFLKGEGVTVGKFFELVTWRRDGLIARLRGRGFNVRTLADRVAALRGVQPVPPLGAAGLRLLSHPKEHIATFERAQLHWCDVPVVDHGGKPAVWLRSGAAVRRRKGRGHADYYIAALTSGDQINFLPAKEADALLHAYGQIAQEQPVVLRYHTREDVYLIPQRQALLPPPHQEVLRLLSYDKAEAWTIPAAAFELAQAVLAKLAIRLEPTEEQ